MLIFAACLKRFAKCALIFVFFTSWFSLDIFSASAKTCGKDYVVQKGDSLASIATKVYGEASQWMIIFYANQDRLGTNISLLAPGLALRMPCLGEAPEASLPEAQSVGIAPKPNSQDKFLLSRLVKRIEFLTAEGYAPMTGRALPKGGMLTDVLSSSMELIKRQSDGEFSYGVSWVNDWSSHLNPLLSSRAFDAGFPWERPDCDEPDELDTELEYRCQSFFFSDPLYEIFEVFFVRNKSNFRFASDNDVIGKRICITIDNGLDDLNGEGRNWVKDGKITVIRPASLQECFQLLDDKAVDAVVAPDVTGRAIATSLGITGKVKALSRPLNIETVHVIVSKTHPHARTLLYYINSALAKLRENGEYDRMVEEHLTHFWTNYEPQSPPAAAQSVKIEKPDDGSSNPGSSEDETPQLGDPESATSHAQK